MIPMRGAVKNTIKILTIEDDPGQVEALREALVVAQIICVEIHEAEDGDQAIKFLNQEYPFIDAPTPDLIFLSDSLPDRSPPDMIRAIQHNRTLRHIPVAIFGRSTHALSQRFCSPLPPNCQLFTRPISCEEWIYVLRCIEDVWVTLLHISGTPKL
jgi:two-component system, chemotaxis family, response regulator Rcp1